MRPKLHRMPALAARRSYCPQATTALSAARKQKFSIAKLV
jgi:hypothetical protein